MVYSYLYLVWIGPSLSTFLRRFDILVSTLFRRDIRLWNSHIFHQERPKRIQSANFISHPGGSAFGVAGTGGY
jgi:hypothetical protein